METYACVGKGLVDVQLLEEVDNGLEVERCLVPRRSVNTDSTADGAIEGYVPQHR